MSNASSTSFATGTCGSWVGDETMIQVNIRTSYGKLLRVQDDTIRADEDEANFDLCNAQFYVDTAPLFFDLHDENPALLYRFRPVNQQHKYLGNSGGHIVLKDVPEGNTSTHDEMFCRSYNFIPHKDPNGHYTFQLRSSINSERLYMSINANHVVIVAPASRSLFLLEPSEGPCKNVLEHILYSATSNIPKLEVKSCVADTVSYWRLARMWRVEVRAAQCKSIVNRKEPR